MNTLPTQTADLLKNQICHEIAANPTGLPFSRFMEMCLYTPDLGYYTGNQAKFGPNGDFITAPEISPLFAQSLAVQFQQILAACTDTAILELGAGTGKFAGDVLLELERLNSLPDKYYIYEVSADLRHRQQTYLKTFCGHLFSRCEWLENLAQTNIKGVIFANEVLDALPCDIFSFAQNTFFEHCVTYETLNGNFSWSKRPATGALKAKMIELHQRYTFSEGYTSEINLQITSWLKTLGDALDQGAIVLFDYGYDQKTFYHPDRHYGTLMCHYRHTRNTNPLQYVGLQDITAHIDFTAVAEAGLAAKLTVAGYTTQAAFLLECQILNLAAQGELGNVARYRQNQAIKTLTMPAEMGEIIKAICLTKNIELELLGFRRFDKRRDL